MKLDTLFLSGGGINCIALLGAFKYLFENNIIQRDFEGIKNIVCVSGASIYILQLLLFYIKTYLLFNHILYFIKSN